MGNCIRIESSKQWAVEDCGLCDKAINVVEEETPIIGNDDKYKGSFGNSASTEVKIKITKKQLEELLGKVDIQGLSVQQVLSLLMNGGDRCKNTHHQRSWRPALKSIPEVN